MTGAEWGFGSPRTAPGSGFLRPGVRSVRGLCRPPRAPQTQRPRGQQATSSYFSGPLVEDALYHSARLCICALEFLLPPHPERRNNVMFKKWILSVSL